MRQAVYSIHIGNREDMRKLEDYITLLLKGENNQCSFIRTQEFVSMRLHALYRPPPADDITVYGDNIKIVLDSHKDATVYIMDQGFIDESETFTSGKRPAPDEPSTDI